MRRKPTLTGLQSATTCWAAACALLAEWREHWPTPRSRDALGDRWTTWNALASESRTYFEALRDIAPAPTVDAMFGTAADPARFGAGAHERVVAWIDEAWDTLGPDCLEAIAWGIDRASHDTFSRSWARSFLISGHDVAHLAAGDFYPVADADPALLDGHEPCSRPASLTDPLPGELPHVRVFEASPFDVVIDFTHRDDLEAIEARFERVAVGHPNRLFKEFKVPAAEGGAVFPIRPLDAEAQARRVTLLTERAIDEDVQVLVLPELSVGSRAAEAIQDNLDDAEGLHLVLAGSRHIGTGAEAANVAIGLLPQAERRLEHHKIKPMRGTSNGREWKEGIDVTARPRLHLYQADQLRLGILICKDFLDKTVAETFTRLGVNLICVPAMSPKTDGFATRADAAATDAQAFTVVACGPRFWSDGRQVDPGAVFGQPVRGRSVVTSTPPVEPLGPLLTVLKIGAATVDP
jgi:predicted amidohydrolase